MRLQGINTCSSWCQEDGPGIAPRQRAFGCCPASLHSQASSMTRGHPESSSKHAQAGLVTGGVGSRLRPMQHGQHEDSSCLPERVTMHWHASWTTQVRKCCEAASVSECAVWPWLPDAPYMDSCLPAPFAVMLRGATAKTWFMPGTWPRAGLMTRPSMPTRRSQWPICMTDPPVGVTRADLSLAGGSWTGGRLEGWHERPHQGGLAGRQQLQSYQRAR